MKWKATIHVGVFWEGFDFHLCSGPRWLVDLRARWHLWLHPYRQAWIEQCETDIAARQLRSRTYGGRRGHGGRVRGRRLCPTIRAGRPLLASRQDLDVPPLEREDSSQPIDEHRYLAGPGIDVGDRPFRTVPQCGGPPTGRDQRRVIIPRDDPDATTEQFRREHL